MGPVLLLGSCAGLQLSLLGICRTSPVLGRLRERLLINLSESNQGYLPVRACLQVSFRSDINL
jgi:hypothetical protein